jgi:hypothetical protein
VTAYTPEEVRQMCSRKSIGVKSKRRIKALARDLGKRYACRYEWYLCEVCGYYHLATKKERT